MTLAGHVEVTTRKLDAIAWQFLRSEFTSPIYADWPIDRRVDAYLRQHLQIDFVNDGGSYEAFLEALLEALLERVMANVDRALRDGLLPAPRS